MPVYITDKISSDDSVTEDSDEENSNEENSDGDNFNEQNEVQNMNATKIFLKIRKKKEIVKYTKKLLPNVKKSLPISRDS